MKNYAYHIGVDISKKTLDISVLKEKEKLFYLHVSNDQKGLKALEKELTKHGILASKSLLSLENTGLYGSKLTSWAVESQYNIWVENPIAIKRSLGLTRGKNDQVDAYRIALYAARFEDKCTLFEPKREVVIKLKHLLTVRDRLVTSQQRLRVPLKETLSLISKKDQKELESTCKAALQGVQKSIKEVEKKISLLIKNDCQLR